MTPYEPLDEFPDIDIYDTDTPVLGGFAGESNDPLKKLADRTTYLYNRLGRFLGQKIIAGSGSIVKEDVFKIIYVVTSVNSTVTLDPVSQFPVGSMIKVKVKVTGAGPKCVRINPNGLDNIEDGNVNVNTLGLYLVDGEEISLIAFDNDNNQVSDRWLLTDPKGNFDKIGQDQLMRIQPRNSVIADGCTPETSGALALRADFARVWARVSAGAINDAQWLGSGLRYRGMFSTGDGSTTFRWPDMRSMVHKGLDHGRGLSLTRLDNFSGGLELDEVKQHDHSLPPDIQYHGADGGGEQGSDNHRSNSTARTGMTGGAENLVKTIGFYPIIFY